jgi:hypothetical protein
LYNQDAGNQLKITLNQTTSDNSVSFYEMPVPLRLKGQGKDTTIVFNHTSSGQAFYTNLNFKVDSVFFDPDLHILSLHNKVMNEFAYLRSLQSLVIYPNPAADIVHVEVNDFANFPRSVELYNVLGEKLLSFIPDGNKFSVSLTNLANGNYYLKIISEDKVYTHKLVKDK